MTTLKGYVIGTDGEPGSYTRVCGTLLCDEGAFEVESVEDFHSTCNDLRNNCEWDAEFALVEEDDDGNKAIIEWDC